MKNSRGFCLVQELVCFCLTAVLLATAIQGFYRSNYLLNESLELQQAVQVAQQVLAGEEYSGRFAVTLRQHRRLGGTGGAGCLWQGQGYAYPCAADGRRDIC